MIQSIYLHKYIVDTLSLFGDLSVVVNRILQEGADGKIDILDRPPCMNRDGAGRYNITITQPEYLELLQCYSVNSPKISIRRIIYWFVDFAIYEQLGWRPTRRYEDKSLQTLCRHIDKARASIARIALLRKYDEETIKMTSSIDDLIVKLKEYLENG